MISNRVIRLLAANCSARTQQIRVRVSRIRNNRCDLDFLTGVLHGWLSARRSRVAIESDERVMPEEKQLKAVKCFNSTEMEGIPATRAVLEFRGNSRRGECGRSTWLCHRRNYWRHCAEGGHGRAVL